MPLFHAVVAIDHVQAHVLQFDAEHVQAVERHHEADGDGRD